MTATQTPLLDQLLQHREENPLGVIARALERDLKRHRAASLEATDHQHHSESPIWAAYDRVWAGRADYRLWRSKLIPFFCAELQKPVETEISLDWPTWFEDTKEALTSANPLVAWGAITVLPEIIQPNANGHSNADVANVRALIKLAEGRLYVDLNQLRLSPAYCGAAAAILLNTIRIFRLFQHRSVSIENLPSYIADITKYLTWIDPNWRPGERITFNRLKREDERNARLRPYHPQSTNHTIQYVIEQIPSLASVVVEDVNEITHKILCDSQAFALTAWLHSRSQRIQERDFQETNSQTETRMVDPDKSAIKMKKRAFKEMELLSWASLAALDAADYLESARLSHFLFMTTPEILIDDQQFRDWLTPRARSMFRVIDEAGLVLDERFTQTMPLYHDQARQNSSQRQMSRLRGFDLRVAKDQDTSQLWAPVIAAFPRPPGVTPGAHLRSVTRAIAEGANVPELDAKTVRSAFEICLHYGFVASAAQILRQLLPQHEDVWNFANAIRRCLTNMPFGLRMTTVNSWLDLLSQYWADPIVFAQLVGAKRFFLHELTMGRFLTIQQTSPRHSRRIAKRYHQTIDVANLREFYDDNPTIHKKGPGAIDALRLSEFIASFDSCELGSPVCLSARLLPKVHSIVATAAHGVIYESAPSYFGELFAEAEELRATYRTWFRIPGLKPSQQVEWSGGLQRFGRAILELAEKCRPGFRWMMLALEPNLASLPWQHLFQSLGVRHLNRKIVVSLVPNLGWAPLSYRQGNDFKGTIEEFLSSESGEELATAREEIKGHLSNARERAIDAAVVLGHGKFNSAASTKIPDVRIGDRILSFDDWMAISASRIVVLHSCHTGHTVPEFLGDFGAVPGMALGLGARVVCAPVAEIPPAAAAILNRFIFGSGEANTVGGRYLNGISEMPVLSLYNLYGIAAASVEVDREQMTGGADRNHKDRDQIGAKRSRIKQHNFMRAAANSPHAPLRARASQRHRHRGS